MKYTPADLARILAQSYGNATLAAQTIGISRATLYRKLEKAGMKDERVRVLKRLRG